jgi:hypothetical protein
MKRMALQILNVAQGFLAKTANSFFRNIEYNRANG